MLPTLAFLWPVFSSIQYAGIIAIGTDLDSAREAKILSQLAVKPFVGALTMRFLGMVEAYTGRLEPIDSPRGESIFVTWRPKIFIEASAWLV